MKTSYVSAALSACVALGLTLGFSAQAEPSQPSVQVSAAHDAGAGGQARIAETTQRLESAFADQFVRGKIDREALSEPIRDVLQAMPDAARPKVQDHIDRVIESGQKAASEMSPEQRAQAAAIPSAEAVGQTKAGLIAGWGWPGYGGWGGVGAFGFPGMFYGNSFYGNGFYGNGLGLGCGFGGCGLNGLGATGWYW